MRVLCITQARTGSTRLPAKVLKTVNGQTLLSIHLDRIQRSEIIDKVIVATTIEPGDDRIVHIAEEKNLDDSRGSVNDVLDRFYQAALPFMPEWIVRITSDCPLIDPQLADQVINLAITQNVDYCSNTFENFFPDGTDVEVFKFAALKKAWAEATLKSDREHVTPYLYNNSDLKGGTLFTAASFSSGKDHSHVRLTVDEPADFEVIEKLIVALGIDATWEEYSDYYLRHSLGKINNQHIRNEGYLKSLKKDNDQQL